MQVNKSKIIFFKPGKNPAEIKKANIYAFISPDTSLEDFLKIIRITRLTEEEKVIYDLILKKKKSAAISAELNISMEAANKLIKSVSNKLKLDSVAPAF
jgi:DNA-binding CsgD family transcriptional regulator